jgi:hypothetical protein
VWRERPAPEFSKATVQRYRASLEARGLAPSSINVRLSAIRKLAAEAADNRLLAPDIAATIGRVKGVNRHGIRTGNWLTRTQAEQMITLPVYTESPLSPRWSKEIDSGNKKRPPPPEMRGKRPCLATWSADDRVDLPVLD